MVLHELRRSREGFGIQRVSEATPQKIETEVAML
jgi:hypothetical protein